MEQPTTPGSNRFGRYVALGDSTTEGLHDPYPEGGLRGWADRFAARLAETNPSLLYANLAIRGRKLPQIRTEQLEPALAMEPDLVSVLGGVNDALRPRVDLGRTEAELEAMVAAFRERSCEVVMFTFPDLSRAASIAGGRIRARLSNFNGRIRRIATEHGAALVDLESDGIDHPSMWSADRLHAGPLGHEWIAELAAGAVGLAEPDPSWSSTLPQPQHRRLAVRAAGGAAWGARHLVPWVGRRLRGVSSGDGREPKRPELQPVLAH